MVSVRPELREEFFPGPVFAALAGLGSLTVVDDHADLPAALPAADVLVTSWGVPRLREELLATAPRLRLVAHTGATVKPFVTDAVFGRGIQVTQAGAGMARSVAEVALGFTFALLHQFPRLDRALRSGVPWEVARQAPPRHEILGCPVGVVGASRTGRAYLELVTALGADVSVYDPFLSDVDAAALGVRRLGLPELMAGSRIVAVHAPVLPETHHLVGAAELASLPDGAGLVNTARSWLVDTAALVAELRTGRIQAALDVYDDEPLPVGDPLRGFDNVMLTPHLAAGTVECRRRQGQIVVDEIRRFLAGAALEHSVTPELLERMG